MTLPSCRSLRWIKSSLSARELLNVKEKPVTSCTARTSRIMRSLIWLSWNKVQLMTAPKRRAIYMRMTRPAQTKFFFAVRTFSRSSMTSQTRLCLLLRQAQVKPLHAPFPLSVSNSVAAHKLVLPLPFLPFLLYLSPPDRSSWLHLIDCLPWTSHPHPKQPPALPWLPERKHL